MSKLQLAGMSLVAAIPAGILAFVSIYAFLSYTDKMQVMMQVVNGITLLAAIVLILTPIVIVLRKGKGGPAAKKVKEAEVPEAAAVGAGTGDLSDPFELEPTGSGDALEGDFDAEPIDDDELAATDDEADMFEFDDEDK